MENVDSERGQPRNELENKRISILQEIRRLENAGPLNHEERGHLGRLKERYNLTRVDLDSLSAQTSWVDPVEKLPEELWEIIIREAAVSTDYLDPRLNIDNLLIYTSVSTKWQERILLNPRLWTIVSIDNTTPDCTAKVATCLSLSGDLPLSVRLSVPTRIWDNVAARVIEQSHRIRSILVRCSFRYPYRPPNYEEITMDALDSVMKSFKQLPILESFDSELYTRNEANLNQIFPITDSWRSLRGVSLTEYTLSTPPLRNLRKVISISSLDSLLPSLELLEQLHEVSCYGAEEINPSQPAKSDPLPWTLLVATSQGVFSTVLGRVTATLSTLNTSTTWEDLSGLISTTSQLSQLQSLYIGLSTPFEQKMQLYFHDTPALKIETLSIAISGDRDELYASQAHRNPNITFLFSILPKWVPSVKKLVLDTSSAATSVLACTSDLKHLTEVTFHCDWGGHTDIEPTYLPRTVERLEFYGTRASFATVHYTEIIHLGLRIYNHADEFNHPLLPVLQEASQLSSIRFLYVKVIGKGWKGVSFPRVEKLILGSSDGGGDNVFSWCEAVALEPTAFPALEHLGLEDYPEWDILFILLKRRNIMTDSGISRIKRIALPATPPLQILRPLQNLLRGEYSFRPSNWELSLAGNASMFFDSSIPGCEMCHSALHFCHSATSVFTLEYDYVIPSLEYPESEDEILITREARMTKWRGLRDSKQFGRIPYCLRHYRYHPVIVTGNDLSGVTMLDHYSDDIFPITDSVAKQGVPEQSIKARDDSNHW